MSSQNDVIGKIFDEYDKHFYNVVKATLRDKGIPEAMLDSLATIFVTNIGKNMENFYSVVKDADIVEATREELNEFENQKTPTHIRD